MKFLLLNQTFYPDIVSTGQHLTDLALGLAERGHEVTVIASRRAYDDPRQIFPASEDWRGIKIRRGAGTGFGKTAKWRRALDFGSFMASSLLRLIFQPKHDVIVALTSPPLISFLGAWAARLRGAQFVYWVMDFNPDEAIAAGWLRPDSPLAWLLERFSRFSLNRAKIIIALDRFMAERIAAKGISPGKVAVIPPWSHDSEVRFDPRQRESFRRRHGLTGKFVVMYSGNHSPCHPLDTLLDAARLLAGDAEIVFCFVGGGSEFNRVQQFAVRHTLPNVKCLPYQPLDQLAGSLSAADLHVVVMGNEFVGLVHPCKIYNVLKVGAPVLYIGPEPSHLCDILAAFNGKFIAARAAHGEVQSVIETIQKVKRMPRSEEERPANPAAHFSRSELLPRLINAVEQLK